MDVDVSSYKSAPQPSMLDTAGKLGALQGQAQSIERQGIGIESDKLKLANERLGILAKEYTTLLANNDVMQGTPAATAAVQAMGQRMVNLGVIPANMFGEFAKSVPTDPKQIPQFINQQMARAQTIKEAIDHNLGVPGSVNTGQAIIPTLTSPNAAVGVNRFAGPGIQIQNPPGQPQIYNGREVLTGPQPPQTVPGGAVAAPPPVGNRLPVAPPAIPPADARVGAPLVPNKDQAQRAPGDPRSPVVAGPGAPTGPAVGQPVLFEEGRKEHVADYNNSHKVLQSVQPLIQAYDLINKFNPRSGPTSETITKWAASAKSLGIIPTETKDDPTAIYQEINKKLNQFISAGGSSSMRSDADQALKEASQASLRNQILPALKKLTYDTIAFQRGLAIIPYMYDSKDYGDKPYHVERGRHINTIQAGQKALMLDHMPDKERDALIDKMEKEANTREGRAFWEVMKAIDKGNVINTGK